jgi:hypothetical protein
MIHGDAEDFAHDKSWQILLAHGPAADTGRRRWFRCALGMVDVLIPRAVIRALYYHF